MKYQNGTTDPFGIRIDHNDYVLGALLTGNLPFRIDSTITNVFDGSCEVKIDIYRKNGITERVELQVFSLDFQKLVSIERSFVNEPLTERWPDLEITICTN